MKQFVAYPLIALVPLIIFWAVIPSFDPTRIVRETPLSAPKWIEESAYGTCSQAMTGKPVNDQTINIDKAHAARIGAGVIQSQTDLLTLSGKNSVAFKPLLVERQFPDTVSRVAWVYGEGRITDNIGMSASAEVIYIDAMSGDPLLLIKNIHAGDPNFTCSQLSGLDETHMVNLAYQTLLYLAGLLITAAYSVAAIMIGLRLYKRQVVRNGATVT